MQQTEHENWHLDQNKLGQLLKERIQKTDFAKVRADVGPFLMDPKELRFFEEKYFLSLLDGYQLVQRQ